MSPSSRAAPRPTWPSTSPPRPPGRPRTSASTPTAASASPRSTTSSASSARRACTRSRRSPTTSCRPTSASTCSECRGPIERSRSPPGCHRRARTHGARRRLRRRRVRAPARAGRRGRARRRPGRHARPRARPRRPLPRGRRRAAAARGRLGRRRDAHAQPAPRPRSQRRVPGAAARRARRGLHRRAAAHRGLLRAPAPGRRRDRGASKRPGRDCRLGLSERTHDRVRVHRAAAPLRAAARPRARRRPVARRALRLARGRAARAVPARRVHHAHARRPAEAMTDLRPLRDLLLEHREDYDAARAAFAWPQLDEFNWALDWFDAFARGNDRTGLLVIEADGSAQERTFDELVRRSDGLANWLRAHGVGRGDRVVLMLGNQIELWESMLAAMKLGAVVIPATTLLAASDLRDRIERGNARHVIVRAADTAKWDGVPGSYTKIAVGGEVDGWLSYDYGEEGFTPDGVTRASDTLLLYFTSGTTARPKLVEHTHASYPVGHLATMYWLGLEPGDVHLNLSSPGWAKHAWSNFFAPWLAEATVAIFNYERFDAAALLDVLAHRGITTFCAPPTVWRMLIQADLSSVRTGLREVVGAGEPLNPEIIERVQEAWGLTLRDGYGQTETTAQIGNTPGQRLKPGSMGRPLPGYEIVLVDPLTGEPTDGEGEICLPLANRPLGLMVGYRDDDERTAEAMRDGYYHTGDVATRDADGYITYVGRTDDVFKASDYRISPFELESVLIEHDAVAEAAVVPSPDPLRLAVPKAYVVLAAGWEPDRETALAILRHAREHLAPYKRIRRLEFAELPKTISGKIRRVELRGREGELHGGAEVPIEGEWSDADFPELRA